VRRGAYRALVGKPEGRRPGVDGRIILKWIFERLAGGVDWIDLAQNRDRCAGSCVYGDEASVSIKCEEFLE
jgi:hypothetical protein